MKNENQATIWSLLKIAGAKKAHLIASGFLAVLSSLLALAPYVIVYLILVRLLDPSFGSDDYANILELALAGGIAVALRYALMFLANMLSHVAAFNILYELRVSVVRHLGELPMGYFSSTQKGKIKKILFDDVEDVEQFIAHHIPDLVSGIALPIIIVGYLFVVDWRMALVALLPLPIALFLQQRAFRVGDRGDRMRRYHDSKETMNGTIVEYVRGMPVVKVFNQTVESFTELKQSVVAYRDFINRVTVEMTPAWAMFVVVTSSGLFFILPFGLWFYMTDVITLPEFFLFILLGSSYMVPVFKLAMMGAQLKHILEGVNRMNQVLETRPIKSKSKNTNLKDNKITFQNVSFAYQKKAVLHNVSFEINPGEVTALVGPSGAGKTTIAQLMLRMWDIDQGEICLGGVNIKNLPYNELMNNIGFVFQDVFIFSDTIYENIRMGMEGVSVADIEHVASAAQCDDFIKKLPKGLHTRIGEGGEVHLSGGEKQRIAMARVILKNAPIVILDEATAYNDAENETKIQQAFSRLMQNKTVIIIAHRLSTIVDADNILVIHDGKVAENGKHETLLANQGVYNAMWQAHTAAQNWTLSPQG